MASRGNLLIAAIAVFPVWRQVRLQGMQTDILKSEAFRRRVSTLGRMREDLVNQTNLVREQLQWYPDHIKNLNFWAHEAAAQVDSFMDFISGQKEFRLDALRVAAARADLIEKLTKLSRALWIVNWDAYLDGEDAPDEEQEVKLQAEAKAAEANSETTIDAALRSAGALKSAILDDINHTRSKLHALSENLVSHGE